MRAAMATPEEDQRASHFRQLRWSLQSLATAGSDQPMLFPDSVVKPDALAADFDHWSSVVRGNYQHDLSTSRADSLAAIDRAFATMSKDGAEFDLELWTEAALVTSEQWAHIRRLATSALEAFDWPIENPSDHSGDQGSAFVR
jgi:hypothetical protein